MNDKAENGSSSEECLSTLEPSSNSPSIAFTSTGEGINSTTESNSNWTPLFLNAVPQVTGTILFSQTAFLKPAFNSSTVKDSGSSKYFSINVSSVSAIASTRASLYSLALSSKSAGISSSLMSVPKSFV